LKKLSFIYPFTLFIFLHLTAFAASANLILNDGFEEDVIGEKPDVWALTKGG
jgi:hypothetical protein